VTDIKPDEKVKAAMNEINAAQREQVAATARSEAEHGIILVLVTQYLDTLKEIGAQGKSNALFMSHSPAAIGDLFQQMQDEVLIGQKAANASQ
jgi:hypothetical protein